MIPKGVTSEYFHTYTDIGFLSKISSTALKYETPVFQEFRTHAYTITAIFPIRVYVYALFFTLTVFPRHC